METKNQTLMEIIQKETHSLERKLIKLNFALGALISIASSVGIYYITGNPAISIATSAVVSLPWAYTNYAIASALEEYGASR